MGKFMKIHQSKISQTMHKLEKDKLSMGILLI